MAQPNLSLHPNSAFLVFRFLGRSSCARQLLTHFAISFCFLVSSLAVRRLLIFSVSSFWLNSTFSYPPLYNIRHCEHKLGHPRTHAISHAPARESDTFDQVLLPRIESICFETRYVALMLSAAAHPRRNITFCPILFRVHS